MKEYFVSYMVVYSDTVKADSPEEAAQIVANSCPYDVAGEASVIDNKTGEEYEI